MDYNSEEFKQWLRSKMQNAEQEYAEYKELSKPYQRTTTVSVKFSPYERDELREKAQGMCMKVSDYIRYVIREME